MFENFGVGAMSIRNEMSGLQGGVHQDMRLCHTRKTILYAHQPVPWKRNKNAEPPGRGTHESLLMDSDEFIVEKFDTL